MTKTNNDYLWIHERIKELDEEKAQKILEKAIKELDEEIAQKILEKAFLESLLQRDSPCIFKSKNPDTSIFHNEKY